MILSCELPLKFRQRHDICQRPRFGRNAWPGPLELFSKSGESVCPGIPGAFGSERLMAGPMKNGNGLQATIS
jgi:hypothetical protein